jgi:hypothetical protein
MNHVELLQNWIVFAFELGLCVFVFARGAQRLLPFFAVYASVILACAIGVGFVYEHFGFRSVASYYAYWIETLLNLVARSLAIAELCRYGLRAYRGIWTLVWQILSVLTLLFLAHAALDAWGQPNLLAIYGLTLERDLDFASITILLVLLIIRNYYGLALEPLQRTIAFGMCVFCAVDVINNTILRDIYTGFLFSWFSTSDTALWAALKPQIERVNDLYGVIRLSSFMISISIWSYALRKPLPAPAESPVLLPAEVYHELSPAMNMRLRAFNNRLLEMLKP